jgi:hypothetical protein
MTVPTTQSSRNRLPLKSASVLRQLWQNRINIRLSPATVNRRGLKACRNVQRPRFNDLRKQRRLLWAHQHSRYGLRHWRHVEPYSKFKKTINQACLSPFINFIGTTIWRKVTTILWNFKAFRQTIGVVDCCICLHKFISWCTFLQQKAIFAQTMS